MNLTATSAVVVDGADVKLAVTCGDESSMALPLGPADRIALACDLMAAARRHLGRAPRRWPAPASASSRTINPRRRG